MNNFYRHIILMSVFFVLTPVTLFISSFSLLAISSNPVIQEDNAVLGIADASKVDTNGANIYAALPKTLPSVDAQIVSKDSRVELVKQYLAKYNSPLEEYSSYIVENADAQGLDFRLITAIAQQESNLCKFTPPGGYNCWGWGIHSRGTLGFESYEVAIATVSKGIKDNYIDEGLITPDQIMTKYTPLSNGSWAQGVNQFMDAML